MNKHLLSLAGLALLCIGAATAQATEDEAFPSLTDVGPYETPSRYASGTTTYNLGPTGARGWYREYNGGELFWGANGREILITHVHPRSPAHGKLRVFDVLVGAQGKPFDIDACVGLGNAIARAQRADGKLSLQRWRNGKVSEVTLQLPRLPGDSVQAPIIAEHSQALRAQFLDFVVQSMHPDGFRMHPVYSSLNALYLLANGKPEHLDLVRRHIQYRIEQMPGPDSKYGPWNWEKGSQTTLMAEYFLATGDRTVLPALRQNLEWMRNSQSYAGGFGHGGPYGGYGHVGLPGMFSAVGAVLARECGVTGFDEMIARAQRFYARAAGLGMIGYGGFNAGTGLKTLYGDNGKSGSAAVLFACLGDQKISRTYANTACALAAYSQSGHTGHFWSMSWGAMGANLGALAYRKHFARELDWYYALSRTWRGGMTAQPWLANMGSYAPGGAELATGGMALWYCAPTRSLRILGKPKSVLSAELPEPLARARQLIYDKQYAACVDALKPFAPADDQQRKQARQLSAIANRQLESIALTLASIQSNIDKGDLYTADRQLHALRPILADTQPIEAFDRLLKDEKSVAIIAAGKTYHDAMTRRGSPDREFFYRAPAIVFDAAKRATLRTIAESTDAGAYKDLAAAALEQWPAHPTPAQPTTLVDQQVTPIRTARLFLGPDADAKLGVAYRYFEFDAIPKTLEAIAQMEPINQGTIKGIDLSARKRDSNFAFIFRTFVHVEKDGTYTFTLTSDDGSVLHVNGEQLIDNGGVHGMIAKSGTVQLKPGRHELECTMFQGGGGRGLRLEMNADTTLGPNDAQQLPFEIADPKAIQQLKLRVKAAGPVSVYLNGQTLCRFHQKRKKNLLDSSWKEWETVTLRTEALQLLQKGQNTLGVAAASRQLGPDTAAVGVKLLAVEAAK